MKRYIIICFLTAIFISVSNAQSKTETINWINSKISSGPIIRKDKGQSFSIYLKIFSDGRFKTTQYNWILKSDDIPSFENYFRKAIFKGSFKSLSPNSVRVEKIDGCIYIYASCSDKDCVMQLYDDNGSSMAYKHSDVLLGVSKNVSLEPRLIKAIVHLIKLCGGKSEAF